MNSRLTSIAELQQAGLIEARQAPELHRVATRYATAITDEMAVLIDSADSDDPIGRQFIPSAAELDSRPEERVDPIGDDTHSPVPGIVHRYPDRVLLKVVHACPVYCRFCFRREAVGPGGEHLSGPPLDAALDYIASTPSVWEVILTGGDPLVLSPRRLQAIMGRIADIGHVGVVRVHSRVPIVAPEMITDTMVDALTSVRKDHPASNRSGRPPAVWLAIHTNHPRELTDHVLSAISRLVDAGVPLVSQTVLLRGVNDESATLESLFRTLVANRVKPYYLHHGDLAPGTGHFRTTIGDGRRIVERLHGRVSGLCQPSYVLDIPGGYGKSPLRAAMAEGDDEQGWSVRDYQGSHHAWPPQEPPKDD